MGRASLVASLLAGWAALAASATAFAQTSQPPAAAQSEPPPEAARPPPSADGAAIVRGVTVTAHRRPPVQDLPRAVSQYIHARVAVARRIEQIPRWGDLEPICVTTTGLDPEFNDFITRRVQEAARRVGAPMAKPAAGKPCGPNIEIIFSDDPQGLVLKLFKRADMLMGYHFAAEVPRLQTFEPPIKAWYATGTRARGQLVVDSIWTQAVSGSLGSRLSTGLSSEFINILVVADTKKMIGYEIGPISDYITMLVLTQPRSLVSCDSLPSILDLLSPDCSEADKPKALTTADLAYLRALYAVFPEQNVYLERDDIWDRMRRELTTAH